MATCASILAWRIPSCLTLCDPVDCSLPDFSVHGILQARVPEGLPFPSPEDLPNPENEPGSPELQADPLPPEPLGKHIDRQTDR